MSKKHLLRRIVVLAMLVAITCVLSYLDHLLSSLIIPLIPVIGPLLIGFKLGFANIVILYIIMKYSFKESLICVILKSLIVGLIYGSITTFLIGFCGTMLSYIIMLLFKNVLTIKNKEFVVSLLGGATHMIGQTLMVCIIYGFDNVPNEILLYLPILIIIGIICGIVIACIYKLTIDKLPKNIKEE